MGDHDNRMILARRVRLAVADLKGLSVLPSVAASIVEDVAQCRFHVDDISPLVEASPELAALVLSLAFKEGVVPSEYDYRLDRIVGRLPEKRLKRACLSVRPCPAYAADQTGSTGLWIARSDFVLHSVAVAQAARQIARMMDCDLCPELAYLGGLLHDMGKMALQQVMPKGYARMIAVAQGSQTSLQRQERLQLGVDHSGLGAYLAHRWHLPLSVQNSIRLHHREFRPHESMASDFILARIVQLANRLVNTEDIGASGDFSVKPSIESLLTDLGLMPDQAAAIASELPSTMESVPQVLRLDMDDPYHRYGESLHDLVLSLSDISDRRDTEHLQHEQVSSFQSFLLDCIRSVDGSLDPLDVAKAGAQLWQRCFQTGKVCLLLYPSREPLGRQVVLIDELAQDTMMVLDPDLDDLVETPPGGTSTELSGAEDWVPLFEEIEARFVLERTRALVLRAGGGAVGALAFEINQPADETHYQAAYQQAASIVAHLLHLSLARDAVEETVEGLLEEGPAGDPAPGPPQEILEGLAEMAAGLAHELNNPLSVVSGRAQLLMQTEEDQERRKVLEQIHSNARDMAQLVESLHGFAEPPQAHRVACSLATIIEEAVALSQRKLGVLPSLDIDDRAHSCPPVQVDSAQIASALANIITNAAQATDGTGAPIEVRVSANHPAGFVTVQVRDKGRGMDKATLQRATHPFFSSLVAGRKRGMGLAYAQRWLQINEGRLAIASTPGAGTTVTLQLPVA
jgi:putative nucleotidyltransferase with HDIG domain